MGKLGVIGFIITLVFGAYLIVHSLNLITFPAFFVSLDKWIYLISGILLILGGYYFWKEKRY